MSEFVPSVIFSGQAIKLITDLRSAHAAGLTKDVDSLVSELGKALSVFEEKSGAPLLDYEDVVEGEPPSSLKANGFWRDAQRDVNILQQQVDILRAAALFSHNLVVTEIQQARNQNARINNKLKALQLYSDSIDADTITFGDRFQSLEFTDLSLIAEGQRLALSTPGMITLPQRGPLVNLSEDAEIKIGEGSNGFLGNNQEILPPQTSNTNLDDLTKYQYKAETDPRNEITTIIDAEPNTWIEYERYGVSPEDKQRGKFNWEYVNANATSGSQDVDWAVPPEGGVLRMVIEFDLKAITPVNTVQITPHGLEDDRNYPILISTILTSPNGTDWSPISPTNVYIGTQINLRTARAVASAAIERAVWAFDTRVVRYLRVFVAQQFPIKTLIGHTYWVQRDTGVRAPGPKPSITDTTEFHAAVSNGSLIQRREPFVVDRWAIGLRDVLVQQVEYALFGVLVTQPLQVGGVVDRVTLHEADFDVPDSYSSTELWVRFYISPDDGESWHAISRIKDTDLGIPEIIAFNDPIPEALRDPNIQYVTVNREVTTLRLKIEMARPDNSVATTPVLRSYTLKVKRR